MLMATLKNNWLIAGISLIVLLFGFFIFANATGKESLKIDKDIQIVPEPWYFNPTEPTNNPNLPQNYSRTLPDNVTCGALTGTICSIQDIPDPSGDFPNMSHGDVTEDSNDDYDKSYREE
jgi:hypothetical protein